MALTSSLPEGFYKITYLLDPKLKPDFHYIKSGVIYKLKNDKFVPINSEELSPQILKILEKNKIIKIVRVPAMLVPIALLKAASLLPRKNPKKPIKKKKNHQKKVSKIKKVRMNCWY